MKLTKIAIALAAVLAMSALVASAAAAAQYKSNASPVMLHGAQSGEGLVFSVDGQKTTCNTAEFNRASQATPANEVTGVVATYANCTTFGFAGSTVNMGNCTYTFKQPTLVEGMDYKANFGIACGATPITIKSSVFGSECEITIGQTGNENLAHMLIHRLTTPPVALLITFTVTGMRVTKVKDNGLCPLSGTGVVNNGTLNGSVNFEGTESIGIYVE